MDWDARPLSAVVQHDLEHGHPGWLGSESKHDALRKVAVPLLLIVQEFVSDIGRCIRCIYKKGHTRSSLRNWAIVRTMQPRPLACLRRSPVRFDVTVDLRCIHLNKVVLAHCRAAVDGALGLGDLLAHLGGR